MTLHEKTNRNDLTEEIIFTILDHLNSHPFAKKSFSLTCKTFYLIESRHRRTLKPFCTQLLERTSFRYPFIAQLDLSLCAQVDDNALNIVSSSSTWKSSLWGVNLSRSRLFSEVGLSSLCVNCVNLVEIDLSNMSEMGDVAAVAIAEAKNLESLWLARCKLITDMGIARIAIGCRKLRLLCLKWCLRIGDLGVGLVALKCKEIRTLDLSYLPITEQCLRSVMQLQYLEDLILEGCYGIDDDGLATLEQSCKPLKVLNMSNCQNISHVGFSCLTNGAVSLQQLTLAYSFAFTADLSKCLQNFPALQSVKFDGCSVTCSGITAIGNWCASLTELSLRACSGLTDEQLSFVVQSHKELKKLDITCCCKITYVSIDSITNSCTSLTSLRMECCSSVSKEAFVLIGQHCRYLEELDVTDNEVDDEGLKSISRCPKLLNLKLGICSNITDNGLTHVGKGCSMLKELDLYRSTGITDVGVAAISHGCSSLEEVNIAYNDRITDASLTSLSKCSSLRVLEIRGCTHVSSVGLLSIAMGCRQLTVLDIKKCLNINDNAMLPLALYSQNLKQINLSYCSVTDTGLVTLANINRLQNMTILHLMGLTPNGLTAALLSCRGLNKVKLHASFKPLLPRSFLGYMEAHGCVFQWRDKAF
ncbi:F-box/LRR-repeat protein 3-like [Pistacia vera]|uniref:F-box/LRR-repeat protein 3-like n=1 Tax=Pistacia vera TaxID=55513 RepID=UPI001262D1D3|nr:F-box/LRR-repeat protein 3-like [Pistacia vera]